MTETIFGKNVFDVYFDFFSLAHVPSANMEWKGLDLTPVLQPATRGWLRCGLELVRISFSSVPTWRLGLSCCLSAGVRAMTSSHTPTSVCWTFVISETQAVRLEQVSLKIFLLLQFAGCWPSAHPVLLRDPADLQANRPATCFPGTRQKAKSLR